MQRLRIQVSGDVDNIPFASFLLFVQWTTQFVFWPCSSVALCHHDYVLSFCWVPNTRLLVLAIGVDLAYTCLVGWVSGSVVVA